MLRPDHLGRSGPVLAELGPSRGCSTIPKENGLAMWFRGSTAPRSVSYTHLDVYKRQPLHCRLCRRSSKGGKALACRGDRRAALDLSSQPDTQSRPRRAISILLSARPTGLILSGHCFYGIDWLDCRLKWTFEWRLRCAVSRSTNTLTHHQREYCCGTQTGCGLAMILGC